MRFASYFQHWNVRTPQWIGYALQSPESHCVHRRSGVHHYNYSDLPLCDMPVGTFRSRGSFAASAASTLAAIARWAQCSVFSDVNTPINGPAGLGAKPKPAA